MKQTGNTVEAGPALRQRWMGALANAPVHRLNDLWDSISDKPDFVFLRKPDIGLVMTQGRVGGRGHAFNMGEMTVTRCSVRLANGTVGHSYLAGRDRRKAEQAAVLDALLQDKDRQADLLECIVEPLIAERAARDAARARKVAPTKVEFFTMVRGEN